MFQKALVCNSRWYLLSVSVIGLLGTGVPEPAQFWDRSHGGFVKCHGCSRGREQGSYFYHLQTLSLLINDNRPLLRSLLPSELLVEEAWLLIWVSKRGRQRGLLVQETLPAENLVYRGGDICRINWHQGHRGLSGQVEMCLRLCV